ncbi:MAG: class I SAM-dependent methyltransferase [Spirochaetes bacterium]|nr:class I SAM-dependent methyltransferase [Spirochaetota bacterium]
MQEEITDRTYWENYYSQSNSSRDDIIKICSQYDIFFEKLFNSCSKHPKTIIEIGAYPGRFLAYLSAKYNLEATALDFNSDIKKINDSFSSMEGVLKEIIQADFLQFEPTDKYDVVLSNGFIEHFKNFDEVLDRHTRYLNPGGALMIMIPNKRYLRRWYGWLVDYRNLKAHNLKCMNLKTFRNFAERNNLSIKYLSYYGGFSYRVHQSLNFFQKVIYYIFRAISKKMNPILEAHPHPLYSGSIVGIFHKPYA